MKLLFDQNISHRIVDRLRDIYPDCEQVRRLELENKSDVEIWKFAKKHAFCIVTFDSDFYDFSLLKGQPPKVLWLRTGNMKTENIEGLLREHFDIIKAFLTDKNYINISCLEIH